MDIFEQNKLICNMKERRGLLNEIYSLTAEQDEQYNAYIEKFAEIGKQHYYVEE